MKRDAPRILLFDIETSPHLGYSWQKYETNIIDFKKQSYMLCFAVKELGKQKITTYALPDYPLYKKDKESDRALVKDLWQLMDSADIIVAHNGNSFDIKYSNGRFLVHGLKPPAPYKTFDTLRAARRVAKFASNKLDDLGRDLGVGRKLPHTGMHLWFGCMNGDMKSWKLMRRYNMQDVRLLERVYLKLRAWAPHPSTREISDGCPTCRSHELEKRGYTYARRKVYHRIKCNNCGAWFQGARIDV